MWGAAKESGSCVKECYDGYRLGSPGQKSGVKGGKQPSGHVSRVQGPSAVLSKALDT